MNKTSSPLNVAATICAILMIVSCFLPWMEIRSDASVMGHSASYRQSASGLQTGMGVIPLLLGVTCLIFVFIRSRYMVIPGIISVFFALSPFTGIGSFTANSTFGQATSRVGFGVYILLFSCVGYILSVWLFRNKRKNPPMKKEFILDKIDTILVSESEPKKSDLITAPLRPVNNKEASYTSSDSNSQQSSLPGETKGKFSRLNKGLIIFGVICGVYAFLYLWADSSSKEIQNERVQKENEEKQRIEQVIAHVNEAVSNQQFDLALTSLNSITWNIDNNQEYIGKYEALRENLRATIQLLKHEKDSLELVQNTVDLEIALRKDSIWNAEQEQAQKSTESFPYVASVVVNRTFIYKEPDINSDRETALIINDRISIMAKQNEFLFCKTTKLDGSIVSGWVLYKDVEKY